MRWVVAALFVAGWVLASRIVMRSMMSRLECPEGNSLGPCREFHRERHKPTAVGALRERTLGDMVCALLVGLAWPVVLLAWLVAGTAPQTSAELERVSREQRELIDRQQQDIEWMTERIRRGR